MAAPIRLRPPAVGIVGYQRGRPPATFVPSPRSILGFQYHYDDIIQVNPVLEQPKLIFYSLAQPLIRWGHRRFVRPLLAAQYGMRAGPRFAGRWAAIGIQVAQFRDRGKTAGVQGRPFTYNYPPWMMGPGPDRTVQLGQINYAAAGLGGADPTSEPKGSSIKYNLAGQASQTVLGVPGPVIIRGGSRAPSMGR